MFQSLVFIGFGIYGMVAAAFRWNSFLEWSQMNGAVQMLGKTGARVLFFLLGFVAFTAGIGLLTGWIPEQI